MFCPECGTDHHLGERAERDKQLAEVASEVEIARITADRDIQVAKITAGAETKIAVAEAESGLAHAEGVAEGAELVIDAAKPELPESEEGAEPVIIESAPASQESGEEAGSPSGFEPVKPPRSHDSGGWWAGYGG